MKLIHHIDIEDIEILEFIFFRRGKEFTKSRTPDWIKALWETASW